MSAIFWECFNADKPNPNLEQQIKDLTENILSARKVDKDDPSAIRSFAKRELSDYLSGTNSKANQTLGVDIFRPDEFNTVLCNNDSLTELQHWFLGRSFEWRNGSHAVKIALDAVFPKGGATRVSGGRESVILDNLIVIQGRRVAIEIESSTNIDNGYWTLRQVLRSEMADYGVMIVPWTAKEQGRANEGLALGRLDREFNGGACLKDGPIYRMAIIRLLDVYRLMLKD